LKTNQSSIISCSDAAAAPGCSLGAHHSCKHKGRKYGEKDEGKLMKAIIAHMKSYNNEQERKKIKEMNASEALEGREETIGDESDKIDLVMAANTDESKEINNNDNEPCVNSNDIEKKGAEIMSNVKFEDNVEQEVGLN
jgi:hypothetical protein